jgi:hypothetical protein
MLEALGEFLEELDEAGGGLIREIQRDAHERQIIGLHGSSAWFLVGALRLAPGGTFLGLVV